MTEPNAITLDDVWKSYGRVQAVRGLTLNVPRRSVFGFLGPNGAGKTTTIRLILGLQRADKGSIALFDRPLARERLQLLRRVGALVDTPALYPHLTGHENLEVHRRLLGFPRSSIDEALDALALSSVADRLVRHYSHGMKQRLGMALALLGQPELLILDEPTNGLDPAGIHEMRSLVRDLPKQRGVTVFLSSHLLSEVEQVATHVAILSQGQIQFQGTPDTLRAQSQSVILCVDQPVHAQSLLEASGFTVQTDGDRLIVQLHVDLGPADINAILVSGGIAVSHLSMHGATLEEVFLQLTRGLDETVEVSR